MKKSAIALFVLAALCVLPVGAVANGTYQALPFSQDWSADLITANNDWSAVPGIRGFLGDITTGNVSAVDPQTILGEPFTTFTDFVFANQTNPTTFGSGGPSELEITDRTIAMQGSGSGDAPHIILYLNTTDRTNIRLQYDLRDIDCQTATNIIQPFVAQYRVGGSGNFANITGTFVANASDGVGGNCVKVTHVDVILPVECEDVAELQIRVMTTNAVSFDELIGVDNIQVTGDLVVPASSETWGRVKTLYR